MAVVVPREKLIFYSLGASIGESYRQLCSSGGPHKVMIPYRQKPLDGEGYQQLCSSIGPKRKAYSL